MKYVVTTLILALLGVTFYYWEETEESINFSKKYAYSLEKRRPAFSKQEKRETSVQKTKRSPTSVNQEQTPTEEPLFENEYNAALSAGVTEFSYEGARYVELSGITPVWKNNLDPSYEDNVVFQDLAFYYVKDYPEKSDLRTAFSKDDGRPVVVRERIRVKVKPDADIGEIASEYPELQLQSSYPSLDLYFFDIEDTNLLAEVSNEIAQHPLVESARPDVRDMRAQR